MQYFYFFGVTGIPHNDGSDTVKRINFLIFSVKKRYD